MAENSNFLAGIKRSVTSYAGYVTRLAKEYSSSTRIKATIKSSVIEEDGGTQFSILTTAGGTENTKDAAAREYGSGIHGDKKAKYPIVPKKAGGVLVFEWDKANDNIPRTKDGRVILSKVMHPGVAADVSPEGMKGYMRPARAKALVAMKKKLGEEGRKGVAKDIKVAFK